MVDPLRAREGISVQVWVVFRTGEGIRLDSCVAQGQFGTGEVVAVGGIVDIIESVVGVARCLVAAAKRGMLLSVGLVVAAVA